mgnify:CR=1 FL=1
MVFRIQGSVVFLRDPAQNVQSEAMGPEGVFADLPEDRSTGRVRTANDQVIRMKRRTQLNVFFTIGYAADRMDAVVQKVGKGTAKMGALNGQLMGKLGVDIEPDPKFPAEPVFFFFLQCLAGIFSRSLSWGESHTQVCSPPHSCGHEKICATKHAKKLPSEPLGIFLEFPLKILMPSPFLVGFFCFDPCLPEIHSKF